MKKAAVIIPARYASTRFPGKPLAKIGGVSMIERVYMQAKKCQNVSRIIVATDHNEIYDTVLRFGGDTEITSPYCQSGTDRCAEVVSRRKLDDEIIINLQGDEPFIQPEQISELIHLLQPEHICIGTLAKKIADRESVFNQNVVKLVKETSGKVMYFSRHPIPFVRGAEPDQWLDKTLFYKHIGLYGYKRDTLSQLANLQPSQLELAESLEQLRWIEAGHSIYAEETNWDSFGIDSPLDLEKAEDWIHSR
jgi:3-deoxy-manno-octulosonate cytidylyltransferase (CMP-KDO synthetase)